MENTLEILLNNEERTNEEILEYFGGDIHDYLNQKTMKEDINDTILYNSFDVIYNERLKANLNPVAEELMLKMLFLNSVFGLRINEMSLMLDVIGAFKFILEVDEVSSALNSYKYYVGLYNKYVANKTSIANIVNESVQLIFNQLGSLVEDFDEEGLNTMKSFMLEQIEKLKG